LKEYPQFQTNNTVNTYEDGYFFKSVWRSVICVIELPTILDINDHLTLVTEIYCLTERFCLHHHMKVETFRLSAMSVKNYQSNIILAKWQLITWEDFINFSCSGSFKPYIRKI
jgi:hypothetical protein